MSGRAAGPRAPQASPAPPARPQDVRNVALIGPSGAGKTTLVEALLAATGEIHRAGRVEDGTTVSDYDEAEVRRQRSIGLALAPLVAGDVKVNLLDTPGYADFVGDLRAGLRAADCALFVVAAHEGVDEATKTLWEECGSVAMPRCLVVGKLNHHRADYDSVLAQARTVFGDRVLPLYVPVSSTGGGFDSLAALLSQTVSDYSAGADSRLVRDPEADEAALIELHRGMLIEGVIEESEDESLMDRYLEGEEIGVDQLVDDLETAIAGASLFPVVPVDALTGLGLHELLEVVTSAFPAPPEHPFPAVYTTAGKEVGGLACDPAGTLLAEVVKTTSDPYVGRISLVRVFSGTLRPDSTVHVSGHLSQFQPSEHGPADHDDQERIGTVASPMGATQRPMAHCIAGDLCTVAKLWRAETGDTLSAVDTPLVMEPWSLPEPLLPIALRAAAKADEDKLGQALQRLAAEDPTVRVEHAAETRQLVLWTMGEAHADVLLERLLQRYGVRVDQVDVRVPLRETFGGRAKGHGRHVKQSGGHGQYAVCDIDVEPGDPGSGFEFVDKVVGGSVPRQFIPSVEKGLLGQLEKGLVAGYPVVDLKVTLVDGKAHSVDSSDMAFQAAGALALRDAASTAGVQLLEPIDSCDVVIGDEFVGAVMSDLTTRRAHVLGTEPAGPGRTRVKAEAPQLELLRYATALRSLAHGTGTFHRRFSRYDALPAQLADKVAAKS
jgi:elongation factor G